MILSDKDRAMSHAKVEGKLMMSVTVKKQKAKSYHRVNIKLVQVIVDVDVNY
jgi:hypothetical protein